MVKEMTFTHAQIHDLRDCFGAIRMAAELLNTSGITPLLELPVSHTLEIILRRSEQGLKMLEEK